MTESESKAADNPALSAVEGSARPTFHPADVAEPELNPAQAEEILQNLAGVFSHPNPARARRVVYPPERPDQQWPEDPQLPNLEARYRALVEQIPAVVFMAYLDRGIGEAYVSPQIEAALGFSQEEWLEDPVRWYSHIHPDDKQRWSTEAAEMFLNGSPLRSAYRVVARDGRVIWFHCEAKMIRKENGEPWFIHGVGFDITDLKRTEEALQEERNVVSAILHTVGALVVVLDPEGRIIRCNRACEQTSGYSLAEVSGRKIWDLFMVPEDVDRFRSVFQQLCSDQVSSDYEGYLVKRDGTRRWIAWSSTVLPGNDAAPAYVIATGIDITERKHLEKTILEVSGREQRRIGQDLHDGLGQHLTGIAFMSKVQEQKLMEKSMPEAGDAAKIVKLVNEAIYKTRELARGLLPVVSDAQGLMSALQQWAGEVEDLFGVSCRFQCFAPVLIHDDTVATHLYYVAREAVNNAIKHGHASRIVIRLAANQEQGVLTVTDNGSGIADIPANNAGMGRHLMNYRARVIGGSLEIQRVATGGTMVSCSFPVRMMAGESVGENKE
ncbi:MAG TPA: PAS domain S-box protein [Terriglobales bacterium]|nr:PAS domain S-box protein [Terriglobales bacterium]